MCGSPGSTRSSAATPLVRSQAATGRKPGDVFLTTNIWTVHLTFMTAQNILKRSLTIDLNHFVKGQKLAGMAQLNLHNSVRDPSFMNEAVAYRLFRDGGVPASRTAYARVLLTVPGKYDRKYLGLYDVLISKKQPVCSRMLVAP